MADDDEIKKLLREIRDDQRTFGEFMQSAHRNQWRWVVALTVPLMVIGAIAIACAVWVTVR